MVLAYWFISVFILCVDYQNRAGNKGAGIANASDAAIDRRERLRRLAMETIDISKVRRLYAPSTWSRGVGSSIEDAFLLLFFFFFGYEIGRPWSRHRAWCTRPLLHDTYINRQDPYILRNHLGGLECRLCLTMHANEGSYLAHTQGKKHQTNLQRRAALGARTNDAQNRAASALLAPAPEMPKKTFVKIGRPGYRITKIREPILPVDMDGSDVDGAVPSTAASAAAGTSDDQSDSHKNIDVVAQQHARATSGRVGLVFEVSLPEIKKDVIPLHRFMSSFEQRKEAPNRAWQYLLVAAEPYETIAFKLQSREIDRSHTLTLPGVPVPEQRDEPCTWSHWDPFQKTYTIQVLFRPL